MQKIQTQGVHHITMICADRQTSIDFWEGVLGMPFVFEQPNLDVPEESHLYFDPGDGRLVTVFTDERRTVERNPQPGRDRQSSPPCLHGCRGQPIPKLPGDSTNVGSATRAKWIGASWTPITSAILWVS